nr:reverse transcriptase domain-containing protein [Tanacetum cinerariifolium]
MEVFMDDFSVFGNSFEIYLSHLDKMLKRCEDSNLCLNWEKSHFMVKEGIVLGHTISKNRIELDKAKVDVIAKLSHPTTLKGIRSFLGYVGFYRRFIENFSKITRPMTHLLEKDTPFFFFKECIEAFQTLKRKLTEAPILVAPDWDLPFELMCDVSDFAIAERPITDKVETTKEPDVRYAEMHRRTSKRKKGYALDYVWEKCKKFHGGTLYPWHDEGYEEEERWESGIKRRNYEPHFVDIEIFEIKRANGSRFMGMTRKEMKEEGGFYSKEMEFEVTPIRIDL